jgi:hypothetical protein
MPRVIELVNQSTILTDPQVIDALLEALNQQVANDFAPVWGLEGAQLYLPGTHPLTTPTWQLVLLDDSDQADALGYHELTAAAQPLGKVFVKTTMADKLNWTVTASHELLEMLIDPNINLVATYQDPANSTAPPRFYSCEVCDACEDDQYSYQINGVSVSDFVTPAWFNQSAESGPFDFKGHITAPFQLLSGGYIGEFIPGSGWTQVDAEDSDLRASGVVAFSGHADNTRSNERRRRRNLPLAQWRRSER